MSGSFRSRLSHCRLVSNACCFFAVLFVRPLLLSVLLGGVAAAGSVGDCVGILFTRPNCSQCASILRETEKIVNDGWPMRVVDLSVDTSTANRWHVQNTPTIVLLRNGREVDRILGAANANEIQRRMLGASSPDSLRESASSTAGTRSNIAIDPMISQQPLMAANVPSMSPTRLGDSMFQDATIRGQSPSSALPTPSNGLSGAANSPLTANATPTAARGVEARPTNPAEATVRIRVDEPSHEAIGTGTIIDTYDGEALVLTCGHLFRDTAGRSPIVIETFIGGVPKSYPAMLVDYRADSTDIGLISFRPGVDVPVARLMDHREKLHEGEAVFSWGCDHGANPTRRDSHITKLNRYLGEPNVEVYGAPVQGRSGGGLFNRRGELIGVCYAADNELNEGLYNAPEVVYKQLMRLGLQRLFNHESSTLASSLPMANSQPLPNRTSSTVDSSNLASNTIPAPATTPKRMTVTLEDGGKSMRWEIPNPPADLLQALQNQASIR